MGAEAVFVGSGIFKSSDPDKRARAIVKAATHFEDAKVVLEALLGIPSEFVRTPKYKIEGPSGARSRGQKQYRNRAGWLPYIEVALGLYFAATIVYAIENENYATIPFLLLFAISVLIFLSHSLGLVQRGNILIGCAANNKDAMYARI